MSRIPSNASPKLRLKRMARWMRVVIGLGAVALIVCAALWLSSESQFDPWTREVMRNAGLSAGPELPDSARFGLMAIGWLNLLLAFFTLLQVWRLFGAYGLGQVFGPLAVHRIRALAWALIATSAWHSISTTLDVLLLTWHLSPGQRLLMFGISWEDYVGVLVGGLLLAMAWAMTEAGRLEQDNASFV